MKMRPVILIVTIVLLLSGGVALAQSSASFSLWWHVIAGGGGRSTSSSYTVNGSIGQPITGASSSAGYRLGAGFWPGSVGAATPTVTPGGIVHRVQMPVVLKNYW